MIALMGLMHRLKTQPLLLVQFVLKNIRKAILLGDCIVHTSSMKFVSRNGSKRKRNVLCAKPKLLLNEFIETN